MFGPATAIDLSPASACASSTALATPSDTNVVSDGSCRCSQPSGPRWLTTNTGTPTGWCPAQPSVKSPSNLADGPNYDTGGPAGSGCSPGDTTSLPDGWWAGHLASYVGTTIDFDLVCYFTGDAANAAAADDGKPTPVDDDRYVRNSNPKTFTESFAST